MAVPYYFQLQFRCFFLLTSEVCHTKGMKQTNEHDIDILPGPAHKTYAKIRLLDILLGYFFDSRRVRVGN